MKIIYQDKKKGVMELLPETLDDLWHLSHIVEIGDTVSSKTTRRIQDTTGDKLRSDRGVKKTFTLGISVDSISFHIFTGKLRITGSIVQGPEDIIPLGSHHTIEAKINTPLKIYKNTWSKWVLKRINQAIESSKKLSAIIICLEDDTADVGLIRQFGVEYYGPILGNVSGKRIIDKNRKKELNKFYSSIVNIINRFEGVSTFVISGPGFYKNDFFKYLQDKYPEIAKKSIIENSGSGGRSGIQEVLKKGVIEKLTAENRIAFEISCLEKIFEEMAKNTSKVAYGISEVTNAVNSGAVSELLVLDNIVRSKNLESLMDIVENMSGEVIVVSSEHEGGKQLESLGGVAALLRYPIK
jgi:protein pelota